jgi:hypothetical protein
VRLKRYANYRIDLAEKAIGFDAVEEAVKEAWEELRKKVNDERLWTIFRNGTEEHWEEIWEENWRKWFENGAANDLKHLEELEKMYPDCAVALVLRGPLEDQGRAVLFTSATDPELLVLLQGGGRLEIETNRSKVKTLIVDKGFSLLGDLRINRGERSLVVQGTWCSRGTDDWNFLMNVNDHVRELIWGGIAESSRNQ